MVSPSFPTLSFPTFTLDRQNNWFVETPCVVRLTEGICVSTGEQTIGEYVEK